MLLEVCQVFNITYVGTLCHPRMSPQIGVFKEVFICLTNRLIGELNIIIFIIILTPRHLFKVHYVTVRIISNSVSVHVDMLLRHYVTMYHLRLYR